MTSVFQIEGTTLVRYCGPEEGDVVIPNGVTIIGKGAFKGYEDIYEVVIPDGVTLIDEEAFYGCEYLFRVNIPHTVCTIGKKAFCNCAHLSTVNIPGSMPGIEIADGAFEGCRRLESITIPYGVRRIGENAFSGCAGLKSVVIPNKIYKIEKYAFSHCRSLKSVTIPDTVWGIGDHAFSYCEHLPSITLPDGLQIIGNNAFDHCGELASVTIPNRVTTIGDYAFCACASLQTITLPDCVTKIGMRAFSFCKGLTSFTVPPNVRAIGDGAFQDCPNLTSVTISDGVKEIGASAFGSCTVLTQIEIPGSVKEIGASAFSSCTGLTQIEIPDSVTKIGKEVFLNSNTTVICVEGSYTHDYCAANNVTYIFDYQYKAFGGLLPQGFEMLASPFLADEEKPFVFISYSHKDRDKVLGIIKELYEVGWKIWYDEGLTIGDKYDETLETHVQDCSAFLLFVTENSLNSLYIKENEIRWAKDYCKPIIKCILDEGTDYDIFGGSVVATVKPTEIERAFEKIDGLAKGQRRVANGISVVFNPADRQGLGSDVPGGNGFAYCMYSKEGSVNARAIMLEARRGGCSLYDAVESGAKKRKLENCSCLIAFLDKAFLSDKAMTETLVEAYKSGSDIAVCMLEEIEDADLPEDLVGLHEMQWLNFAYGITADMNTKLARHLQKRGCRDVAVLPGFEYETTDGGIIIKKFTGIDPSPRIDGEYGGVPVIEIADRAFEGCKRLESIIIPNGVRRIGTSAFSDCTGLKSVTIPGSVTTIEVHSFKNCYSLASIDIPYGVTEIGPAAFVDCTSLTSATIPASLDKIVGLLFCGCESLTSVNIPESIQEIEEMAFEGCKALSSITIPSSVRKIHENAFKGCRNLTVSCPFFSYARKYCRENGLKRR